MPTPVIAVTASNPFQYAIETSSPAGLAVVIALALLSCFSWAVMISKVLTVRRASKGSANFLHFYRRSNDPLHLYAIKRLGEGSTLGAVYEAACRELSLHLTGDPQLDDDYQEKLSRAEAIAPSQLAAIEREMERATGEVTLKLEGQMTLLAMAVSGGPFLGLLGTVWGVMDVFTGIALAERVASIKEMAPGVSSALVTTVIGLLVAIPAMFGYNYLANRIRELVMQMENFSSELSATFSKAYVDHQPHPGSTRPSTASAPISPTVTNPAPTAPTGPVTQSKPTPATGSKLEAPAPAVRQSTAPLVRPEMRTPAAESVFPPASPLGSLPDPLEALNEINSQIYIYDDTMAGFDEGQVGIFSKDQPAPLSSSSLAADGAHSDAGDAVPVFTRKSPPRGDTGSVLNPFARPPKGSNS
jgi:biopolymer transport protein TolQ